MRYLISLAVFFLTIVGLGMVCTGSASYYIDFPSFILAGIFPILFVSILFGFKETASAFSLPFQKDAAPKQLIKAASFFKMYSKTMWITGLIATLIGIIATLGSLGDNVIFGNNLAVTLITILYCSLIHLAVIIPFNLLIEKQSEK